jgi:FAD/FMN-containing dehydrogenase
VRALWHDRSVCFDFLVEERGADAVELMARIQRAFDPLNILNPGKVLRV